MSLSEAQIDEAREVFQIFDKVGDSKIDSCDIGTVLRAMDKNPPESEVKKIQTELDPSGAARITFQQFLPILSRPGLNVNGTAEDFIDGLRVFDKDGNGFMSLHEFRHVMTTLGEQLTPKQIDQLIAGIETDKEGNINYEEFVRVITKREEK